MHSKDIFFLYCYNISYSSSINFLEMISMVFSKSNVPKQSRGDILTVSSSPIPIQKTSIETTYYMQNSMIGRLMNTKNCANCPKH
jgi:hypothetical protein